VIATPGWLKCVSSLRIDESSLPPQLFDTDATPAALAAVSSAATRSAVFAELASTSRILQSGHADETASRSRLSSSAQP
jgi:hypothetical protein